MILEKGHSDKHLHSYTSQTRGSKCIKLCFCSAFFNKSHTIRHGMCGDKFIFLYWRRMFVRDFYKKTLNKIIKPKNTMVGWSMIYQEFFVLRGPLAPRHSRDRWRLRGRVAPIQKLPLRTVSFCRNSHDNPFRLFEFIVLDEIYLLRMTSFPFELSITFIWIYCYNYYCPVHEVRTSLTCLFFFSPMIKILF